MMINVNDFKNGVTIQYDNNIYQVLEFQHVKPGKGSAFVRSKLKNLRTRDIIDHTFNSGIKIPIARIDKSKMQFLYKEGSHYNFMNMVTFEQVDLSESKLKNEKNFLKEGLELELNYYNNELLGIILPEKINLKIINTENVSKGNTVNNSQKDAVLETGLVIKVPLFINEGEEIIISTKDGRYVGRC